MEKRGRGTFVVPFVLGHNEYTFSLQAVGLACSHQRDDKSTLIALATTRRTSNRGVSLSLSVSSSSLRNVLERLLERKESPWRRNAFVGTVAAQALPRGPFFSALTSSYVECK